MTSLKVDADFMALVTINGQQALEIRHPEFFARIFLQGAHLTEFAPKGSDNWLWLSSTARYAPGVAIRGGVPVCWPWFGDPARNPTEVADRVVEAKAHGFARTLLWALERTRSSDDSAEVTLTLDARDLGERFGDWPLTASITFHFTATTCRIALATHNVSDQPVTYTEALHTYFPTSDITRSQVVGFDGSRYTDTLDDWREYTQSGAIRFDGEVDRIYHSAGKMQIDTPEGTSRIESQGSASTVVWNPGPDKAARLADLPDAAWTSMLCVETANATSNSIRLMGSESHTTQLVLSKDRD